MNTTKLIALLVLCLTFSGCLPLLVGGAVGYGISQSQKDHSRWLERERIRRHNERIVWEMYRSGEINYRQYRGVMRDTGHSVLPPVGLEHPEKPWEKP
jgi:hypothetical protein